MICLMLLISSCTRSLVIQDSYQLRDHLQREDTGVIHTNDGRDYDLGRPNTYTFENDTIFLQVRPRHNPIPRQVALPLSDINRLEDNSVNWGVMIVSGILIYIMIIGLNSQIRFMSLDIFK